MEQKGHCKHGEFNLREGCPDCIQEERERREAEALGEEVPEPEPEPIIVKVRYLSESTGEVIVSGREYAYFSAEPLKVGDVVQVPVRDRVQKAVVTAIDVTESEIADFRFDVKTIPAGSVFPGAQAPPEMEILPAPLNTLRELGQVVEPGLLQVAAEAERLRDFAVARVITTNEDLKPATDDLSIIANAKKLIMEKKAEILAPFKSQVDGINAAFADLLQPLDEADQITREKVKAFREEQQRKAAEAQRIEDEKLKLAQAEMELTGEHTQELGTAVAPPAVPDHTRTGMGTQGFQKVYKWEVTDFAQVPDQYKMIDTGKVTGVVKGSKGTIEIPGIRVWTDEAVRINTR